MERVREKIRPGRKTSTRTWHCKVHSLLFGGNAYYPSCFFITSMPLCFRRQTWFLYCAFFFFMLIVKTKEKQDTNQAEEQEQEQEETLEHLVVVKRHIRVDQSQVPYANHILSLYQDNAVPIAISIQTCALGRHTLLVNLVKVVIIIVVIAVVVIITGIPYIGNVGHLRCLRHAIVAI